LLALTTFASTGNPEKTAEAIRINQAPRVNGIPDDDFYENLKKTIQHDQLNQISVKFLYYLDYQSLIKHKG